MTIVHRREELRASVALQTRAFSNPRIHFDLRQVIDEVKGMTAFGQRRVLRNLKTGVVEDKPD